MKRLVIATELMLIITIYECCALQLQSGKSITVRDIQHPKALSMNKGFNQQFDFHDGRRKFMNLIFTTFMASFLDLSHPTSSAIAAQTAGEAVRRSAANLPGYGQPDIFYPSSFVGKWRATRVIISSDDPTILKAQLPLTLFYDVRFITTDGDSEGKLGADEKVIADRQFNEESYYNALKTALEKEGSSLGSMPSIQKSTWSPFNPNLLTINYSNSSMREVKVTKRANNIEVANGILSSSEYRRITTVDGGFMGDIPSITGSRVLTKWKFEDSSVDAIELVYTDDLIGGDPMSMTIGSQLNAKTHLSSKSRVKLQR